MNNKLWNEIRNQMESFDRIDKITDIILLGEEEGDHQGVRRIKLTDDALMDKDSIEIRKILTEGIEDE